jgi:2-polyprenyl-3-methyl-5-hydroxy-6-metoxy-1,4-benzoquinol methylase
MAGPRWKGPERSVPVTVHEWIRDVRQAYLEQAAQFLRARRLLGEHEPLDALAARWSSYVSGHFDARDPDAFYRQWQGEMGASNIPTNIQDQLSRDYVVAALATVFVEPASFGGRWLDFGCGTAAISLNWQHTLMPQSTLLLADVDNLPREFVRERAASRPACRTLLTGVDLSSVEDESLDAVLCIDVLEHLPNPSEVFRLLHRRLRSGGVLIVQAPWGGHPEHLESAPVNWQQDGGASLLDSHYLRLVPLNPGAALSAIYWKKLAR